MAGKDHSRNTRMGSSRGELPESLSTEFMCMVDETVKDTHYEIKRKVVKADDCKKVGRFEMEPI